MLMAYLSLNKGKMKFSEAKLEDLESLSKLLSDLFNQEIEFSPDSKKQLNSLKKIISNKNIGKIYTEIGRAHV